MGAFKNDGSVQANSRTLVIGSAAGGTGGTTYVAENFTLSNPSKTIERTDELDEPSGQYSYRTFRTGTATLQYALVSTVVTWPLLGYEFTTTVDNANPPTAEIFYISETSTPETHGEQKKINITFRKKYN